MTTSLETLRGYHLKATDGVFGRIRDILFEEGPWTGRWIVADTGDWLFGRKVLLSPVSFFTPVEDEKTVPLRLSRKEIEAAPSLDEDAPISRTYEKTFYDHYMWPYYWMGEGMWGNVTHPAYLFPTKNQVSEKLDTRTPEEKQDPPLRSGHELTKYRLMSGEDVLGYVEDVLLDPETWEVKYFQCDTRKWFHGKTLHVSPEKVTDVDWHHHRLSVDFTQEELLKASENEDKADEESTFKEMDIHVRSLSGIIISGSTK